MVRSFCCCCCWGFFGGCGTRASSPFGVTGTMTIKMINRTSRMSIIGVTLMSPIAPPLLPPLVIAMASNSSCAANDYVTAAGQNLLCRAQTAGTFTLVGEQAHLINAGSAHSVNRVFDGAELRTRIRANEDLLARRIGKLIADLAAQLGS